MTNLSRLAANLQAQVNDLRDDNDRLARALNHSTERLAATKAHFDRHCREDDERAELLTAERDAALAQVEALTERRAAKQLAIADWGIGANGYDHLGELANGVCTCGGGTCGACSLYHAAKELGADRDHHRETLRRVYREVAGDEDSGTAVVTMETREPWLFEATK